MADKNVSFEITKDNSEEIIRKANVNLLAALEAVGIQAVSHAQTNVTKGVPRNAGSWYTSKGASGLRGSISHKVVADEKYVAVGTNNSHAIYNEFGTGKFASGGNGRSGWWVYVPGSTVKGSNNHKIYTEAQARQIVAMMRSEGLDAHMTQGMKPLHFLKNAVTEHVDQYKAIIKKYLNRKI